MKQMVGWAKRKRAQHHADCRPMLGTHGFAQPTDRYFHLGVIACLLAILLSWSLIDTTASQAAESEPAQILAPGYGELSFTAPTPGSYQLPVLSNAANGNVLDSNGQTQTLHQLYDNKLVLLSFIYTSCSDVNGCPLATMVLSKVKRRLEQEPALASQLRIISLSFDPQHDTPEVLKSYSKGFVTGNIDWRFITTQAEAELTPILNAYDQAVNRDYNAQGEYLGTMSHILRVFLLDKQKQIRNIYSVSFLHADTLVNDLKTLLHETGELELPQISKNKPSLHGTGDVKQGYESSQYLTATRDLTSRIGKSVDLVNVSSRASLGLPPLASPPDNPLTNAKVALGRKLFYDRRLSLNDTQSCAMCHIPEQGFTSNELQTAVGFEGRTVRRNSPTLYNVGYLQRLFHDGREYTLEQQVWSPLLAANEMANPSIGYVIEKLKSLPDYADWFEDAFGGSEPTMTNIGKALASYQRTLVAANSPFDRWYYGKDEDALSEQAKSGFRLFTGKAGCVSCHQVNADYALFTDQQLHNTGIGYANSMWKEPKVRKVQLAPGVFIEVESSAYAAAAEARPNDLGLYEITQDPADRWKYKTPTLRNVALTAPYMHDGSMRTLYDVVDFYVQGGIVNELLDPRIKPLPLSRDEKAALVEFLYALTGSSIDSLLSDAFAAPVGDVH